ncbi:Abi family protein [Limosilactobacillus mucosae]|uniref:Abi family protein n=1 Tax=Limosilactobacillus mucosae TaxID=97478 RepID=UPI0022E7EB6A|nr:Abi family protein [Limosilactobacillus mucosae]
MIAKEQNNFLKMIQSKARRSASKDVKKFDSENKERVYLPIWLIMNELTLGDSIHIVKLMTEKNKRLLAKQFNCKAVELIKWLDCINLVRNVCCHNGNLIDIRFKTKPKIPKGFENFLVSYKSNGGELVYTNRLSIAICIIVKLMGSINIKYRFGNLINSINHLIDTTNTPQAYGFKNRKSIYDCFSAMTISEKPQS